MVVIRRNDCGNGDECPALDRRPGGGIEVTGYTVDRPGLPPGESVVLVPDTLLPEIAALDVALGPFIAEHHRTDLLRVQTLDFYGVASDGDDFHRYLTGAPAPTVPGKAEWLQRLRDDAAAGKTRRNVHVVREPLNDYLRYQFEWCYVPNAAAGQQIRVLSLNDTPAAAPVMALGDFSVIESVHAVRMRYAADGSYEGAAVIGDDAATSYRTLAELAWNLATPFADWWAAHPQYHRAARASCPS